MTTSSTLALAEQLHRDQMLAARAIASLMLYELPDEVRSRGHQAIHDGAGYVELRTRVVTGQAELGARGDRRVRPAMTRPHLNPSRSPQQAQCSNHEM